MNRKKNKRKYHTSARLREERQGHIFHRDDADKKRWRWFYVVVDILLVLVMALGAVSVYAIWAPIPLYHEYISETRAVQYTLEITDIREEFLGYARVGMPIEVLGTGDVLGTVDCVEIVKYGEGDSAKSALLLQLTATASYLPEHGYYVGDFHAIAGNCVEICFDNVYGMARCVEISVKE